MAVSLRHLATWALVVFATLLVAAAPARATGELGGSGKFVGWWELGGFYGTDESSRGEVVLFTPLMQSALTLFFLDARGKLFEEDVQEANLALGYRQMMPSGWNLGLWAGWDIRDTEEHNTFHQVAFGLEALSERYDLRVNGYVPVTDPKGSPGLAEVVLRGNNILMIGGEEVPLYGVDGEVGVLLFGGNRGGGGGGLKGAPAPAKRHELRAYAGGFWFDADEALEEVAGPKGRLEYRINDVISSLPGSRLTLESELSYDEVRDTKFEIGARLRIPFGARGSDAASRMAALTGQELRMIEGLERDTDIITVQSKEENVFDTLTNVNFDRAAVLQGGGDLQGTLDANGPNSLIILDGGTTNGSFIVGPGQTLQGGASTILVTGVKSGTTANFTAPGAKPFLTQLLNQAVVLVDSNTHLAGLRLTGAGQGSGLAFNDGIVPTGDGVSNVAITGTMIMGLGGSGIDFGNDHNNIVFNNVAIQNVQNGIEFINNNANVSFQNVTIRNVINRGVIFFDDNSNVTFTHMTIVSPGDDGILFLDNNSNVTLTGSTISNMSIAALFGDNNNNITLSGNTTSNTGNSAFSFNDDNTNIMVSGNTISNTSTAVFFSGNNDNVTVSGNTISNVTEDGIFFGGGNSATITGNTLTDIDADAIDVGGGTPNTLTITDNTFAGTIGGDVVEFDGGQIQTLLDGSGNRLVPGTVVVGALCRFQNVGSGFVGVLQITDQNGVLQTFVNGAGCT